MNTATSYSEALNTVPLVIYEGKGCEIGNLYQVILQVLWEKKLQQVTCHGVPIVGHPVPIFPVCMHSLSQALTLF